MVQRQLSQGEIPAGALLEGVLLLVGAALLLTPGFLTDLLGFAALIAPLRRRLVARVLARLSRAPGFGSADGGPRRRRPTTIEGEYRREDD